jgi:hypothetical protein
MLEESGPKRKRGPRAWQVALCALAAVVAEHGEAGATPPDEPTIELLVIHATTTDAAGTIDPKLRDLPQLTKEQPFVRYNVYRLLDRRQFPLEAGRPATYDIVNGRTLRVTLASVTRPDGGESRYQLETEIGQPGKAAFLKGLHVTASANQPFFVGGQSYQGGTLFLELVVRSH